MKNKDNYKLLFLLLALILFVYQSLFSQNEKIDYSQNEKEIEEYNDLDYIVLNNNNPEFSTEDYIVDSFEEYSSLDYLNRAGVAYALLSEDLMPTEERKSIGNIKPTGWHTIKYDFISGKYLYNRCHLIGYQLSGENDNEKNLITCTRNMNTGIMLDYENMVAEYIKTNHEKVLYRVTPYYEGENMLATGIQMEGCSVIDNCEKIKFNIFVYNIQDGVEIDYTNGDSKAI